MATQIIARAGGAVFPGEATRLSILHARVRSAIAEAPISASTAVLLSANLALLLAVCLLFFMVQSANNTAAAALQSRDQRLEIANEFARTSDEMTRAARAYAVTRDPRYRSFYDTILAIRDRRHARPLPYGRTYWSMVIAGQPQNAEGRRVPLARLAREAGFDGANMVLLSRSARAEEALAAIERKAMRLPPAEGRALLFSNQYSVAKADVMELLDTVLRLVEHRSDAKVDEAQDRASWLAALFFAALCAAAAVATASAWRFVSHVVQPLCRLSAFMDRTARAPDDEPIPYVERRDEIGRMARALAGFRSAIVERDRLNDAEQRLARHRDEDFAAHRHALEEAAARTQRAAVMEDLVHGLGHDLGSALVAVEEASGELNECAHTMTLVAHGAEKHLAQAEAGGRDTAEHVDAVAATCRQLARATGEIETQTERSIASADEAVDAVRRTRITVEALMGYSENIQGIVALIGQIANKTNRLAINATIEAAHAGEAGRGFSVVAAEVKSLARQTTAAADEVSLQLGQVREGSRQTFGMVDAIARSIADAREISLAIGSAVEQQATATGEISLSADLAAKRTRDSADTIAAIRHGAQHAHQAIGRVVVAASALTGTNDAVRYHVDRFAGSVRQT